MKINRLTEKFLSVLAEEIMATGDLIDAVLSSPYGASQYRLQKELRKIENKRIDQERELEKRRRFHDLLYRLHRDGLIERTLNRDNKRAWKITKTGENRLPDLKSNRPLPAKQYSKQNDGILKIVAFDIPEKYRRTRDWLRSALTNLGFEIIQKSVWVGKAKLPEEFMNALQDLNIVSFVEIFAVTKTGSLKKLHRENTGASKS